MVQKVKKYWGMGTGRKLLDSRAPGGQAESPAPVGEWGARFPVRCLLCKSPQVRRWAPAPQDGTL